MKQLFRFAMLALVATAAISCSKNGTRCRCRYKSPIQGKQEFIVDEEEVMKVARSCAGYESFLNEEIVSDFKYKCFND